MSLKVGELYALLSLDVDPFNTAMESARQQMNAAGSMLDAMVEEFAVAGAKITSSFATPIQAIATSLASAISGAGSLAAQAGIRDSAPSAVLGQTHGNSLLGSLTDLAIAGVSQAAASPGAADSGAAAGGVSKELTQIQKDVADQKKIMTELLQVTKERLGTYA